MEKEICAVIKGAGKALIIMMGHGIQMTWPYFDSGE